MKFPIFVIFTFLLKGYGKTCLSKPEAPLKVYQFPKSTNWNEPNAFAYLYPTPRIVVGRNAQLGDRTRNSCFPVSTSQRGTNAPP